VLQPLLGDRARLEKMADRARSGARPHALDAIVSACLVAAGVERAT